MIARDEWRWATIWALVLVVVAALPYLIAYLTTPEDLFYTGFLSNPEDGHSYLAKMRQGLRGEWLFHLPFTPEPHQGEFLYTYYLLLGHLARWTRLPLVLVFHLSRTVNGLFLLLVLYYAVSCFFHDLDHRRFAFLITAIGSGFGWLAVFLIGKTVDTWVPEGYIFYSLYVNPHFPLAIALMLLLMLWSVTPWGATHTFGWRRLIGLALCSAALGLVLPFCLLIVGVVLLTYTLVRWIQGHRLPWREIVSGVAVGAAGLPFVLNAYLASIQNPAFAAWSAQNQTLSPPLWDYAIGYGVVLLLALVGMRVAAQRRRESDLFLLIWTVSTVVLLYIPFSLQRRLVTGLIVPLGALATIGWHALPDRLRLRKTVVWAVASLTHFLLIGMAVTMALNHYEDFFLTRDEHAALNWLTDETEPDALVVAAPQTGLYIPAWAGQRVFYGHRFETANADERKAQLTAFFEENDRSLLADSHPGEHLRPSLRADYVFYGPREQALATDNWQPDPTWTLAYRQGAVTIYALPKE